MSDPESIDLGLAKALTNPMRQRILRRLRTAGDQTSTTLAHHLGVTTGATSYNLRVLAEHGLVEPADRPGGGRERWWRAVPRDLRIPPAEARVGELGQATNQLIEQWLAEDLANLQRAGKRRDDLGEGVEMPFSRGVLTATPDLLRAFFEDYLALLKRYQADCDPAAEGARPIQVRLLTYPDADDDA